MVPQVGVAKTYRLGSIRRYVHGYGVPDEADSVVVMLSSVKKLW